MMPIYDCGAAGCAECDAAFGPDRTAAIASYQTRRAAQDRSMEAWRQLQLAKLFPERQPEAA